MIKTGFHKLMYKIVQFQKKFGAVLIICLFTHLSASISSGQSEPIVIKMATIAPKGTGYYQVLQDIANDWSAVTDGAVEMRVYPSGVSGDEQDIIRKMRIDQIQAGALSIKGLHDIDESVYGLNYPMMVQSWEELDWLRDRIGDEIAGRIQQKGFRILFWADVGWIYFFSTSPIEDPDDVKNMKLFSRATDFDDLQIWKTAGFNPVPLTTNDVLPSLQTGLIDVVQTPAFLALSSQWFGVANHMLDLRWAALSGAFMITNRAWERIPEEYREVLQRSAFERSRVVQEELRYQSEEAINAMKEYGLIVHDLTEPERLEWQRVTESFFPKFEGVLVPRAMHERVMNLWPELKAFRQSQTRRDEPINQ